MATRARGWTERAIRIRDATFEWIRCVQEWKAADQAVTAAIDPSVRSAAMRYAESCQKRANLEQRILARVIYDEATMEERARMPAIPHSPRATFVLWAREEAKSEDPHMALRWEGLLGVVPLGPPRQCISSWPPASIRD